MSEPDLIDGYISELRPLLSWRSDSAESLAEIEDHLRTSVERMSLADTDPAQAQRLVVERFGRPLVVAKEFTVSRWGRFAMPTTSTRGAGLAAMLGAVLWMLAAGAFLFSSWFAVSSEAAFLVSWLAVIIACMGTICGVFGMYARAGAHDAGAFAIAGGVPWVFSIFAGSPAAWLVLGLMATPAVAVAMQRWQQVTDKRHPGAWALSASFPFGLLTVGVLYLTGTAETNAYGEYTGFYVGFVVAALLMGVGLYFIGRQLRAETPAPKALAALT